MKFSAQQIATLLNGTVEGNPEAAVTNLSKIEEGKPGTLSFLANATYTPFIYETDASVVIVNKSLKLDKPVKSTCTLIRVEDAYGSFAQLLEMYNQIKTNKKGIKVALNILNIIKFPMPSLEYSNGKFKLNALSF